MYIDRSQRIASQQGAIYFQPLIALSLSNGRDIIALEATLPEGTITIVEMRSHEYSLWWTDFALDDDIQLTFATPPWPSLGMVYPLKKDVHYKEERLGSGVLKKHHYFLYHLASSRCEFHLEKGSYTLFGVQFSIDYAEKWTPYMRFLQPVLERLNTNEPFFIQGDTSMSESIERIIDGIIDQMISRGSTVTKAEALSVFEELSLAMENILKEGNAINTPLFKIIPSISGVFINDEDGFDPSRHEVKLRINPGLRLRQTESKITVERTTGIRPQPVPIHFDDYGSETQDDLITGSTTGRITGSLLKFDEKDPQQGVFFVNIGNGTVKQVTGKFVKNKPGELIFANPTGLTTGIYRLEVRAILAGTKAIRTGALPYELTVS